MTDTHDTPNFQSGFARKASWPRRTAIALMAAGSLGFVSACTTTNPYTGDQQLALYSEEQLAQASSQAWQELIAKTPTVTSGAQYQRVQRVWSRVVAASPKAREQFDLRLFQSDSVNAFVMPGNRVGVYTGLVNLVENDDQLAAVLGHELAHAIYRHANQRASRAGIASTAAQIGGAIVGGATNGQISAQQAASLGSVAANLGVVLPYSRNAELEADLAGVDYMHAAGFNPRQAARLWEVMASANSQRVAEFLSTHPDPATRRQRILDYIQSKGW